MRHIHSQWAHQPRDCLALRHRRTGTRSTTTWYSNIFPADDANVGRTPRAGFLWYGCGVEYTLKCVCTSCLVPRVLHGTERQTLGDLELVCNEAVLSRGRGPGTSNHTINIFKRVESPVSSMRVRHKSAKKRFEKFTFLALNMVNGLPIMNLLCLRKRKSKTDFSNPSCPYQIVERGGTANKTNRTKKKPRKQITRAAMATKQRRRRQS